jgi:hypothetical protein
MNNLEKIGSFIVDLALIFGIVYLASNNTDGWGWLLFILFCKEC